VLCCVILSIQWCSPPKQLEIANGMLGYIVDMKQLVAIRGYVSSRKDQIEEAKLWTQDLFKRLGGVHPKLCKFFLTASSFSCVWVFREDWGAWEKCHILDLSSWDIVTGVYDDI
jgi:hypothetical protein